jgi:outer membrane lipoprotein-sorting protein
VNILRRLPLSRLLLLCALVVAIGVSGAALASALDSGATPPQKPLAQAIHDALAGSPVDGVTAHVTLTNRLLEGASLASGSGEGITSSPLVNGGSGRLWVSNDGHMRLELQAEKGDTQLMWDGHTAEVYDAANNTLYRYTPKASSSCPDATPGGSCTTDEGHGHEAPSVAKIEEAISHLQEHANVSEANPTNVGGQPAYTVRVSPKEAGSLIGGAELSFDAAHGLPLRAAVYSSTSSSPVVELAASEVSYGPVDSSVFEFSPPPGAKVEEVTMEPSSGSAPPSGEKPTVTTHGKGITAITVVQHKAGSGEDATKSLEGLPKVTINGVAASELRTELGTILTFERSGMRYVLAGALAPGPIEELARGL